MKKSTLIKLIAVVLCTFYLITGCSTGNKTQKEKVDLASLSMDELIAKAKDEGVIESVGMPDDWANWKDSWDAITKKYGIKHYDTDMSSAEEIAIFKAEANSPTKDIGDVGHAYSKIAIQEDVLQGYKPSTWDSIPDWAKDPDGRWILSYTGTVAFTSNINLTGGAAPTSWADIHEGNYMVSPAM